MAIKRLRYKSISTSGNTEKIGLGGSFEKGRKIWFEVTLVKLIHNIDINWTKSLQNNRQFKSKEGKWHKGLFGMK